MEMNANIFTDLKTLSSEERKAHLRSILESKDGKFKAVLFDAQKNRTVSIFEMADEMGIDACVDFLDDLIENAECKSQTLTKDEVQEVLKRVRSGNGTEEDEEIFNAIMDSLANSNTNHFHMGLNEMAVEMIEFAQNNVGYQPYVADVLGSISILCLINLIHVEECAMHKHINAGPEVVTEIATQVADDIYNAWEATLTEKPDPSLVLSGLMFLALRVAKEAGYKFVDADTLKRYMGLPIHNCNGNCDCDGSCDCENECDCCNENENGSNEGNIAKAIIPFPTKSDEEKEMRDILKE